MKTSNVVLTFLFKKQEFLFFKQISIFDTSIYRNSKKIDLKRENLGNPSHITRHCPKPLRYPRAIRRKHEYLQKKKARRPLQQLLVDMFLQKLKLAHLDENTSDTGDKANPDLRQKIFNACDTSEDPSLDASLTLAPKVLEMLMT